MTVVVPPQPIAFEVVPPEDPGPVAAVVAPHTPPTAVVVGDADPGGGCCEFTHHQAVPASEWLLQHGQDVPRDPVVFLDTDPDRPSWTDWTFTAAGTTVLTFPAPVTGYAYL